MLKEKKKAEEEYTRNSNKTTVHNTNTIERENDGFNREFEFSS